MYYYFEMVMYSTRIYTVVVVKSYTVNVILIFTTHPMYTCKIKK